MLAPAAAFFGCERRKSTGYDGYAFIANEDGQAIAVVDLNTFTLARHVTLDASPSAVLAAPGRPSIYALTPANGLVHEIGMADPKPRRRLHVGRLSLSMRQAVDRTGVWVLNRQPRELVRIGAANFHVEARIALPLDPVDFDLSPDGESAVVSFEDGGGFGLVDLKKRSCRTIQLGRRPSLVRFRFDGRQVLITGADEPVLSIADARSGRLIVHLPLAVTARHLCFKSDGGQLFITGDGMDAVVIVYPYRTEVAQTLLAGRAPGFLAECIFEDTDNLFVANPASGEVTVVDIDTLRVTAVVGVGRGPAFITMTPDAQYALVLNRDSGDMAVIRLAAIAAKRDLSARDRSAALFTMVPVGSRPVGASILHV